MKKKLVVGVFVTALLLAGCGAPRSDPDPLEITITQLPNVVDYGVGDKFDSTGLVVEGIFDDGNKVLVQKVITKYTLSVKSNYVFTLQDYYNKTKEITVTYREATTSFTVNIIDNYDFSIGLSNGKSDRMYIGETASVKIYKSNDNDHKFKFESKTTNYVTVDQNGNLTPLAETEKNNKALIEVTDLNTTIKRQLSFLILPQPTTANGTYDNSRVNVSEKAKILGELEKNAMDNMIGGIPIAEKLSYVRFASPTSSSNRTYNPGTKLYVTGYGFGMIREGEISGTLPNGSRDYPDYLHVASSNFLNVANPTCYAEYIDDIYTDYTCSPYWGKRLRDSTTYEWYPVLAADTVGGEANMYPIHMENDNEDELYTKWRIYLKTDLKYKTLDTSYTGSLDVKIEDYAFAYQLILTSGCEASEGYVNLARKLIKGADLFYEASKTIYNSAELTALWNQMSATGQLGIRTGKDDNGSFLDIETTKPMHEATAREELSNKAFTPINKEYIEHLTENSDYVSDYTYGLYKYGEMKAIDSTNNYDKKISFNALSLGPYYYDYSSRYNYILLTRNDDWFDVNENAYKIPGIYVRFIEEEYNEFNRFMGGALDYAKVPVDKKNGDDSPCYENKQLKLLVNSADQGRWDYLFGRHGIVKESNDGWTVNPLLNNKNFLKGLYFSIDRQEFARRRGLQPQTGYIPHDCLIDPMMGAQYNNTDSHREAMEDYETNAWGEYNGGYNLDRARSLFRTAINELVESEKIRAGTKQNPTTINIKVEYILPTDAGEYARDLGRYFETAFNDDSVYGGKVQIRVSDHSYIQREVQKSELGRYDLLLYTPYTETLFSNFDPTDYFESFLDRRYYFDKTEELDNYSPIIHNNEKWSYEALVNSIIGPTTVENGVMKKSQNEIMSIFEHRYFSSVTNLNDEPTNNLYNGCKLNINFSFSDLISSKATVDITEISLYDVKTGDKFATIDENEYQIEKDGNNIKSISMVLSQASAFIINKSLADIHEKEKLKILDNYMAETDEYNQIKAMYEYPFTYENYYSYRTYLTNLMWTLEVSYTITIDGVKSDLSTYIYKNSYEEQDANTYH